MMIGWLKISEMTIGTLRVVDIRFPTLLPSCSIPPLGGTDSDNKSSNAKEVTADVELRLCMRRPKETGTGSANTEQLTQKIARQPRYKVLLEAARKKMLHRGRNTGRWRTTTV